MPITVIMPLGDIYSPLGFLWGFHGQTLWGFSAAEGMTHVPGMIGLLKSLGFYTAHGPLKLLTGIFVASVIGMSTTIDMSNPLGKSASWLRRPNVVCHMVMPVHMAFCGIGANIPFPF